MSAGYSKPDWNRISAYYRGHQRAIIEAGRNAWALNPYQWEFDGGIKLTPIERLLWSDIRTEGVVLYPQYPVGRFFVDFANPAAKVAIECDGASFHTDQGRDDARQAEIEDLGWHVYRITGADCRRDDVHDDNCNRLLTPSPGRELLRMVCELHDIRVCRQIMEAH